MDKDIKYWLSLVATVVAGAAVITLYPLVFNGIESPSGATIFLFVISVIACAGSAGTYYYLKAARQNPKTYEDLSILENSAKSDEPNDGHLTKN